MTKLTLSLLKIPLGSLIPQQLNTLQVRRSLCILMIVTAVIGVAYQPPSRRNPPRRQTSFTGTSELFSRVSSVNSQVPQFMT
ncbi:MAG: hypothetical protein OHK0047_31450 [Leptolyngbyaceae cyanobacterium]|uniref:hypothetical protein n=1 Tax=Leptodesmis sichuanensis TaxID=2906798 RepID=UPI001F41AEA6|nr:hypothetical protein [Leptodesmis sichuanensis]UIE39618.1 hypothetical protein KIK02_08700 [Leptodesmis sichuanensis A121]